MTHLTTQHICIDIFCRVIDNYGDIGVCWRLARQLTNEFGANVRLWVDELAALKTIWPSATLDARQTLDSVEVVGWTPANYPIFENAMADMIIEAFACEIPAPYQALIAQHKAHAPLWVNLDYLSAEAWIEDCHKLASVSPSTGIKKTFFFPGFTQRSGGLLRENKLLQQRKDWPLGNAGLEKLGLPHTEGHLNICLFSYENDSISPLMNAFNTAAQPVHLFIAGGKSLTSINTYLSANAQPALITGQTRCLGNLTLTALPYLPQTAFDQLLWSMDINFIRGEDSLVRAHWAGAPFVWHIYKQEEDAHIDKLNAFLDRFLADADAAPTTAIRAFWLAWNQGMLTEAHWHNVMANFTVWQEITQQWRDQQIQIADLASQLMALTK